MMKLKQRIILPFFEALHVIPKRGNRLSFCVYGTNLKYIVGAIHNAILAKDIYPDWICRFYIEEKTQLIRILTDLNCEVFCIKEIDFTYGNVHPVTYRFLALEDPLVDRAIFRDTDSRVTDRERVAVKAWLESGKDFHRMKEWDHLNDPPIMSGAWGAKAELLRNIRQLLCSYKDWKDPKQPLPGDFFFLEKMIWPIIKDNHIYHGVGDDRYGKATPFPPHQKIDYGFVGARVIDTKWGM